MATGITVRELADEYFTVHCTHPVTQQNGRYHLRPVLRLVGGWQARRLKPQQLSEFVERQRLSGVSLATAVLRAKLLLTIMRWGVGTGRLTVNPLDGVRFPKPQSRRVMPPSLIEARKMRDVAAPHVARVITLGMMAGPRIGPSELFRLRWDDVDLDAGIIRTPVAKAFRRWVLDVLDRLAEEERAKAEPVGNSEQLPDAPITPADQSTLQAIVKAKVEALPRDRRGGLYPQIWSRFNNHFRLARYCQLPQSRMSEAITYLTQLDVAENGRALPASAPVSTEFSFRSEFPADMDAGRKDALRKIQGCMRDILAARDVVSMFCYPAPSVMNTSAKRPLTYAARHDFYAAALDCLSAAHAALEAGYRLNRLHE